MNSEEVLQALRAAYPRAAIIPEMVLDDDDFYEFWGEDKGKKYRRIDALMLETNQRTAIEVKVSKSDFSKDGWVKRRPWAKICHRYVYAVPAGLGFPTIDFEGCGLWWVHPDGRVEVKRRAKVNHFPEPVPNQLIAALAYRAAGVPVVTQNEHEMENEE